jgi:hypothetical protein
VCLRDVALASGTERAFTGKTVNGYSHDTKSKGLWVSAIGGLPLFDSSTKFDSGTGRNIFEWMGCCLAANQSLHRNQSRIHDLLPSIMQLFLCVIASLKSSFCAITPVFLTESSSAVHLSLADESCAIIVLRLAIVLPAHRSGTRD